MKNLAWLCAQVTKDGVDPWLTIDDVNSPGGPESDRSSGGCTQAGDASPSTAATRNFSGPPHPPRS